MHAVTGPGSRTTRAARRVLGSQRSETITSGSGRGPLKWTRPQGRYLASGLPERELRGKGLAVKPGSTRRYHIPPEAARTIAALLALRGHVIAPIMAGVRPRMGPGTDTADPFWYDGAHFVKQCQRLATADIVMDQKMAARLQRAMVLASTVMSRRAVLIEQFLN